MKPFLPAFSLWANSIQICPLFAFSAINRGKRTPSKFRLSADSNRRKNSASRRAAAAASVPARYCFSTVSPSGRR